VVTKKPVTSHGHSLTREAHTKGPEAAALAEVARAVRDDCRKDPKAYLDEAHVAASGE
jgi:hypothetical protein